VGFLAEGYWPGVLGRGFLAGGSWPGVIGLEPIGWPRAIIGVINSVPNAQCKNII